MEEKTKENMINSIKSRIESEHRKHQALDWAKIAAIKIVANIEFYYNITKKDDPESSDIKS